jgi:hypothetical protein
MANLGSPALCSRDDKKDSNKSVEIRILRFPGNKSKISDLSEHSTHFNGLLYTKFQQQTNANGLGTLLRADG